MVVWLSEETGADTAIAADVATLATEVTAVVTLESAKLHFAGLVNTMLLVEAELLVDTISDATLALGMVVFGILVVRSVGDRPSAAGRLTVDGTVLTVMPQFPAEDGTTLLVTTFVLTVWVANTDPAVLLTDASTAAGGACIELED